MSTFPLQIGTPDGLLFEGDVTRVVCRSITGDLAILAGHCNFCTRSWYGQLMLLWRTEPVGTRHVSAECFPVMDGKCGVFLQLPGNRQKILISKEQNSPGQEQKKSCTVPD